MHLQGPDVKGTSVRWGALAGRKEDKALGITLPYVHFAVKDLGQMFYVDVGVLDDRGQLAVVRVSTFQVRSRRAACVLACTADTASCRPLHE